MMEMETLANIFKALSDKTRLRIVLILNKAKTELCVCEIMDSLNETQYNVSRKMKILKEANIVQERRDGKWVFYSTNPGDPFVKQILEAVGSEGLQLQDVNRLKERLSLRKDGKCVVGMHEKLCSTGKKMKTK